MIVIFPLTRLASSVFNACWPLSSRINKYLFHNLKVMAGSTYHHMDMQTSVAFCGSCSLPPVSAITYRQDIQRALSILLLVLLQGQNDNPVEQLPIRVWPAASYARTYCCNHISWGIFAEDSCCPDIMRVQIRRGGVCLQGGQPFLDFFLCWLFTNQASPDYNVSECLILRDLTACFSRWYLFSILSSMSDIDHVPHLDLRSYIMRGGHSS